MQKLKQLLDNKVTWLAIGSVVGTIFGENAAAIINAVGAAVMALI